MNPKFIHIATDPEGELYALDEDGGVWELLRAGTGESATFEHWQTDRWQRVSAFRDATER